MRDFAEHTKRASASLQIAQRAHVYQRIAKQRRDAGRQHGHHQRSSALLAAVVEHQDHNDRILRENKERLAVGAKGEAVADIVDEGDQVAGRFEEVRGEGDAGGGFGADEVDDLGDLDKGGGADNGYA